jgi:hypothetical protein
MAKKNMNPENLAAKLSDPEAKKALLNAMKEISETMSEMETSRIQIGEIVAAVFDKYEIPKPYIRKVARLYHKQTVVAFENEAAVIKDLYKAITS